MATECEPDCWVLSKLILAMLVTHNSIQLQPHSHMTMANGQEVYFHHGKQWEIGMKITGSCTNPNTSVNFSVDMCTFYTLHCCKYTLTWHTCHCILLCTNLISSNGVSSSSEELTSNSHDLIICWRTTENRSRSAKLHFGFAAMVCRAVCVCVCVCVSE